MCNIDDQIVLNNKTLQEILNVANAVSSRGKGISMHQALSQLEYKKIRAEVSSEKLVPMIEKSPSEREGFEPNAPICSISVIYKNSFR